jgi:uncharacterized protein
MDVFGPQWHDHDLHIRANWNAIAEDDDLLLVAGDISWATHFEEARPDLEFLATLKGQKLLLKGNHDFWWQAISKLRAKAPPRIAFLQNDSHVYGDVAIAGARGWRLPGGEDDSDRRIFDREVERLALSLADLEKKRYSSLIVMTHYPPLRTLDESTPVSELIERSRASCCVYGHLHGPDIKTAAQGCRNGVLYRLVSADAAAFTPVQIWPCSTEGTCV